jgi:hypothetical protein
MKQFLTIFQLSFQNFYNEFINYIFTTMKTNPIKQLSGFALALGISLQLSAQAQLIVTLNNNSIETFALTDIRSIKFGAETMHLHSNNGNVSTWNISDISNYRIEGVTGLNETEGTAGKLEVFPNPATNQMLISFSSAQSQHINIEIFDLLGKKIRDIYSGNHSLHQSYPWQVDVPQGLYICRVTTKNGITTKSIIIK